MEQFCVKRFDSREHYCKQFFVDPIAKTCEGRKRDVRRERGNEKKKEKKREEKEGKTKKKRERREGLLIVS